MKPVQLFPICGIDNKLVGLELYGWKVCIVHRDSLINDKSTIYNRSTYQAIENSFENLTYFRLLNYIDGNPFYYFIYKQTDDIFEVFSLAKTIRLFKTSDFGMAFPITLNPNGALILNTPYDLTNNNYGHVNLFYLTNSELDLFNNLYKQILQRQNNPKIKNMIELYNDSFRLKHYPVSFLLRVICMEMLIDSKKGIKHHLSQSVSRLIGKNKDEVNLIENDIREIYKARSEYVHNASTQLLDQKLINKANDYARRSILES